MTGITTHVLDSGTGRPGAGMRIDFSVREGERWTLVKTLGTNADGRTDQPVLAPDAARTGEYELLFHVGEYFRRRQPEGDGTPPFLDTVPVRFAVFDASQHYHVPMLCTPWSCSTYRGS